MKISLIATVKDAGPAIQDFLASVRIQTRRPDEVVLVDGGSTDGTWEALREAPGIVALWEPGANIARGRNLAIKTATHEIIAVTDADCVLAPDWVEEIVRPLERGADVAAGFYRPIATSFLQTVAAAATLPEPEEIGARWMPSSRSLAFRRPAFESAGGYPEWLDVGEDMYLNHRFVDAGVKLEQAPRAVTYWRVRPTLALTWRQYARYAEGDAVAGMYPERHAIRFGTYAFLLVTLLTRNKYLLRLALVGGAAYAARPVWRAWRRLPPGGSARWRAVAAVPAMMAFVDGAKMQGYLRGLRQRGEIPPPAASPP